MHFVIVMPMTHYVELMGLSSSGINYTPHNPNVSCILVDGYAYICHAILTRLLLLLLVHIQLCTEMFEGQVKNLVMTL